MNTQLILGAQAALIALNAGVVGLTNIDEGLKAVVVLVISVLLAFIGPFVPKVSEGIRRMLELQRRGN